MCAGFGETMHAQLLGHGTPHPPTHLSAASFILVFNIMAATTPLGGPYPYANNFYVHNLRVDEFLLAAATMADQYSREFTQSTIIPLLEIRYGNCVARSTVQFH